MHRTWKGFLKTHLDNGLWYFYPLTYSALVYINNLQVSTAYGANSIILAEYMNALPHLSHGVRVTHIYVSNLTVIGWDNVLSLVGAKTFCLGLNVLSAVRDTDDHRTYNNSLYGSICSWNYANVYRHILFNWLSIHQSSVDTSWI